jgi:Dolichyl-phosphate-mannose-protein mannosyltransferase
MFRPDCHWKRGNYREMTCLWFILGALIFIRFLESCLQSFRADEFLHLHDAWMVSQKFLPYRDFFEHHACWYHYAMAPAVRLFSPEKNVNTAVGFLFFSRAVSFVIGTLALALLFKTGRNWMGKQVGILAAILLSGVPLFLETSVETRPDVPALALWIACVLLLVKEMNGSRCSGRERTTSPSPPATPDRATCDGRKFMLAGLCLGAAVMFTQKLLFVLPGLGVALGAWIWFGQVDKPFRRLVMTLFFANGVAIPAACTWLFFVAHGAGGDFVDKVFLINSRWAYHMSPSFILQRFWDDSVVFAVLTAAGALWVWVKMIESRRIDWTGIVCQAVIAGWLVGLCRILPVADLQFFLIPLPLAALLASRALSESSAIAPRWLQQLFLLGVTVWAVFPSIAALSDRIQGRSPTPPVLKTALWVIQNTDPQDTVMDGWGGTGVFRPQAWYYGFVHNEIPPMIPQADRESLMRDLEMGRIQPRIIFESQDLFSLHERLLPWIKANYKHDTELGIYIRPARGEKGEKQE